MTVIIDGVSRGTVDYNRERDDIEIALPRIPRYGRSEWPGHIPRDRRDDADEGLHTISWTVTDARE